MSLYISSNPPLQKFFFTLLAHASRVKKIVEISDNK